MGEKLREYTILTVDSSKHSASCSICFAHHKNLYPQDRKLSGLQTKSGHGEEVNRTGV
jgi:hypothetical protein